MTASVRDGGDTRLLCDLESLPDRSCKGFSIPWQGRRLDLFVVRQGQDVYGYVNSCPHTGASLDWVPDQFLATDGKHIQCATHGALFRLEDGYCISGPCAGQRLRRVPVEIVDGGITVTRLTVDGESGSGAR